MTNEKRRGVNEPASLSVFQVDQNRVDTNHTRTVLQNVNTGCDVDGCTHPTFQALGSARFCYGHRQTIPDLLRSAGYNTTAQVGMMQFSHSSSSDWPDDYASLCCDNKECGATYVGINVPYLVCKYCLRTAEKK